MAASSLSFLAFFCYFQLCFFLQTEKLTLSTAATQWLPAGATWYGSPNGAGSDGGACGYGSAVSQAPFSSLVTAVGPSLYQSGKECGACFQVKCTQYAACSGNPARVVITDSCPGGPCLTESAHFDLSGTALGAMAIPGQEDQLRNIGVLQILYARVACDYSGQNIVFKVDQGSNPYYIAVLIEYEEGDGDLAAVELLETSSASNQWRPMQQSWGAVWKLDAGGALQAPISFRLTTAYSGQTLIAENVIPVGWTPGAAYRSLVNYL